MKPESPIIRFNDQEVAFREIAGLGVAMRRGDLFEVEGAGLDLLRSIRTGDTTCSRLASSLSSRYGIPPDTARADTKAFVHGLAARRIILWGCTTEPDVAGPAEILSSNLRCWEVARERLIPLKCKFDVTYRCNIACKFCYNGPRPGLPGPYPTNTELDLGEVRSVFKQLYEAGTFIMTISGGEPLARRDITSLLDLTDEFGFAVEILTNGTLITDDLAAKLAAHRLQLVVIPLFGAAPETHDAFVRQPGAFDRACRGIATLRAAGIEVGVRCAITNANFPEWKRLRAIVDSLKARYFPHVQIHLSSDGLVDLRDLRLEDASLAELFEGGLDLNPGYRCDVGFARVDVLPNGDVALCSLLTEPLGNLRHQTFKEIWRGSARLHELRSLLREGVRGCNGCSVRSDDAAYRCSADALFDDGGLDRLSSEALRVLRIADSHSQGPTLLPVARS